jgi:deoxyribonuclease-2
VDWFFQYKMPNSYKVAYADSTTAGDKNGFLQVQEYALDDEDHPPALILTLRSLAKSKSEASQTGKSSKTHHTHHHRKKNGYHTLPFNGTGLNSTSSVSSSAVQWEPYFMYNDQPDNAQPSGSFGHTKGVVAVGSKPFWLLHSTPNFPSSDGKAKFYFPQSEIIYGQTFLCVALGASDIEDIAGQLLYTKPYVYVNKVGDASGYPKLAQLLDGSGWVTEPGTSVKKFGKFTHVAKNAEWDQDMYEDLIAPTIKSDLRVESWLRGLAEGTYCKPRHDYNVEDIENLVAQDYDGSNITWRESQDHAKWAISVDSGHPYVCIADINRMTSQRSRGGGAFCFQDASLARQLTGSVTKHAQCRGPHL